jgi:hypothetical protein
MGHGEDMSLLSTMCALKVIYVDAARRHYPTEMTVGKEMNESLVQPVWCDQKNQSALTNPIEKHPP